MHTTSIRTPRQGKALTTRDNLSVGIGRALDKLPPEYIRDASPISLSTTLATNACVENKGSRAKLLIFGLTDEFIRRFDAEAIMVLSITASAVSIPTAAPTDSLSTSPIGTTLFPSTEPGCRMRTPWRRRSCTPYERRSVRIARQAAGRGALRAPAGVCQRTDQRHQCVLTRGATALLNARLLPIVREFIDAALSDFSARGCKRPSWSSGATAA